METDVGEFQKVNGKGTPNEDRLRLLGGTVPLVARANRGQLFAVMDGVGGAPLGMRAAQHVADRLTDFFRDERYPATVDGLVALLREVNHEVAAWGCMEGGDRPLAACAATVAWLCPPVRTDGPCPLVMLHAGDSSGALYRDGAAKWLTHDHSAGRGLRNYVGKGAAFEVEIQQDTIEPGDFVILVTDGVTRAMQIDAIGDIVRQRPIAKDAARSIVEAASRRGSRDDITAVVVELLDV